MHEQRHREFNTPAEMLARVAFLVMLLSLIGSAVLLVAAFASGQVRLALAGLGTGGIAWLTRQWLHRTGNLEKTEAAFDALGEPPAPVDETQVAELVRLLREWEDLERKRGSPDFDPWALQAVRHDIHELVENHPALGTLFRAETRRRAA